MIYVTADTHGERERFEEKSIRRLKKGDTLIVLGDFGFLWDGSKAEKKNLAWLARRRYKILFLDGCHDNYDLLKEYPLEDFCGGRARHIGGNLYHVLRGSVLELEGKKLLCFGGGESFDKEELEEGVNWWRAEMPTSDELGLHTHPRRPRPSAGVQPDGRKAPGQLAARLFRPADHPGAI